MAVLSRNLALAALILGFTACFATIASTLSLWRHSPATEFSESVSETEIRLDFHPFTDAVSSFVFLREDGKARTVRYNRSQLTVVAEYQGTVSRESTASLLKRTRDPGFQLAFRRKDFSSEGLSQGDQFDLSIETKNQEPQYTFGFLSNAPTVLRSFVGDLLALEKQLTKAPLAEAYLVSKPIAEERFKKLRSAGRLRFALINEFPSDLQPVVRAATSRPRDFHVLNKSQYERFLTWSAQDHEFFIVDNDFGHQLNLFHSAK